MTLKRISAVVFSMIFGVVTLAAGTLLVLGGQWAGLILLLPGAALVAVAMKINDRPEPFAESPSATRDQ
jgi:hypothetical protein